MNKKSMIVALFLAVIMSLSFVLVACDKDGDEPVANVKDAYVIQYTDDTGTYVIDVKLGEPYSMSAIPTREGYDFLGLFDGDAQMDHLPGKCGKAAASTGFSIAGTPFAHKRAAHKRHDKVRKMHGRKRSGRKAS